jgi:hypothetical protein
MTRYSRQRPRFRSDAESDRRLADYEKRREAERLAFDAMIEQSLAARTPERIQQDKEAMAAAEARQRDEQLRRRRAASADQFSTLGT